MSFPMKFIDCYRKIYNTAEIIAQKYNVPFVNLNYLGDEFENINELAANARTERSRKGVTEAHLTTIKPNDEGKWCRGQVLNPVGLVTNILETDLSK